MTPRSDVMREDIERRGLLAGCVALLANVEFDEDRGKSPPVDVLPEPEGLEVRAAGG